MSSSVGSNFLSSIILAPFVLIMSAVSLSTLQRGLDWITRVATTPQSGTIRKIKPYVKQVNAFFERILEGNRFTINSTDVVLMAIAILLLCLVFESHSNRIAANQRDEANRKAAARAAKNAQKND